MDASKRHARLQELHDLAQGSEEFEGGVTFEDEMEALVVGDWAFFAIDEIGDLALSFHLDSHPVAVARLTSTECEIHRGIFPGCRLIGFSFCFGQTFSAVVDRTSQSRIHRF
jgi:hypothetical protein